MSAYGRKRPFISLVFAVPERPLWRKEDISGWVSEIGLANDRFTPGSGRWAIIELTGR